MKTTEVVLFPAAAAAVTPSMVRKTSSSTMEEAKFSGALNLAHGAPDAEGPVAMRVWPCTYCSPNVHTDGPVILLWNFLARRPKLIKAQQSMKHGCMRV
jgi:hypothetical protein